MGAIKFTCVFLLILVSISSLPINLDNVNVTEYLSNDPEETVPTGVSGVVLQAEEHIKISNGTSRNTIRPGMVVNSYSIEIEPDEDDGTFSGTAIIQVSIVDQTTREDPIILHVVNLDIESVQFSLIGGTLLRDADFDVDEDEGLLEIDTGFEATFYRFVITYTGSMDIAGEALWGSDSYIAMNLHPTHARRVFPCMDEPTEAATISFTFNDIGFTNIIANSMLEDNSQNQFRALQGPAHLWGMVAHNFITMNIPTTNVLLLGRPGVTNQDAQASLAINAYFNFLNEWTSRPYFEIVVNQDSRMHVIALPDVDRDWHALSTVGIWEPHILMETSCSVKQRKTALVKIAEAMAKQWFGYVIYPENWQHEWVISGLATYAAYEAVKSFQSPGTGNDITLLDMNTLFVTDIIQESLLRDAYTSAQILEPGEDIFEEDEIRDHIYGLLKYKAPAIMHMMRLILSDNDDHDFVQSAGRALIAGRALQTVNSLNFVDAVNSDWLFNGNGAVDDIEEFLEPWTLNNGYPLIHVGLRQGGVLLTQERFTFSSQPHVNFEVPITYTTSINPNFDIVRPIFMMDATTTLNMALDEEDWVLLNMQGQGYYRVNYDGDLWERIIEALEDPDRREEIHPLNRATLVDDALNLARAGRLDYDIAFRVVLSMEHETEYAVWKAFVRNMDFLRKRLVALVTEDEDLDPDIYLRMVRRTVGSVENEIGFNPDPLLTESSMVSLTRGLVMDHACRANYQPCIAAAVDWFYDPNSNDPVVNPNIPQEIRPAVYCTMVREGDDDVRDALKARFEIELSHYERVIILESLACSQDDDFIRQYLDETIAANSPYSPEERVRIFMAIAESSFENAWTAVNFISRRSNEVRDMYGGAQKLEEIIFALANNMADAGLSTDFGIWVNAQNNNLEDSQMTAERALAQVNENLQWDNRFMEYVYEWIDENDAPTLAVSLVLVCITVTVTLFNH